ncbi:MAG TPA: DUF6510 family protein [Jiangellales bacterium]|nr:DUF6510 family protein [Jiangellales bacterium]
MADGYGDAERAEVAPEVIDEATADGAYEDGNALAGPLSEVFGADVTVAVVCCSGCGRTGPVAGLRVYGRAPGLVARCAGCDQVVLRLVRGRDSAWLDLRGTVSLRLPLS